MTDRNATIPMPRHVDGLGWTTVRCDCGWTNGIWPYRDDAIRTHMEHDKRCTTTPDH